MRKRWYIGSLVFSMLLAVLLVGCKDDKSTNGDDELDSQYVGTWIFQSATINGDMASLADVMEWTEGTVVAMLMIESDGDCIYQENDQYGNSLWNSFGTFEVSGTDFTLTFTSDSDGDLNPADVATGTVSVSSTTMTITTTEEGSTIVFTLAKAQSIE